MLKGCFFVFKYEELYEGKFNLKKKKHKEFAQLTWRVLCSE